MENFHRYRTENGNELLMTEDQAEVYGKISNVTMIQSNVEVSTSTTESKKSPKFEKVSDLKEVVEPSSEEPKA